ncbi:MAG: hypothetical protein P8178_05315 [Candidatus Thiodiazotropha sp.]
MKSVIYQRSWTVLFLCLMSIAAYGVDAQKSAMVKHAPVAMTMPQLKQKTAPVNEILSPEPASKTKQLATPKVDHQFTAGTAGSAASGTPASALSVKSKRPALIAPLPVMHDLAPVSGTSNAPISQTKVIPFSANPAVKANKPDVAMAPPRRMPSLVKSLRSKLESDKATSYTVLTQQGPSGKNAFSRKAWTGKILLPNLARQGKPIRIPPKGKAKRANGQAVQWLLENPDGSLSKQIRDVNGRLAGNITFTPDGSTRVAIDLTGDQEADLYELITSDGEHSLLASPAGKTALDHFLNGGSNPLCSPDVAGTSPSGGGFAGGMISASDETAMQVTCGRNEYKPGNGGSTAGGSGGISGDPGGQVTDSMCKDVLSRHRARPGNPGMVEGNPAPEDREDFNWSRALQAAARSLFHTAPDRKRDTTGQDTVSLLGSVFGGTSASVTNAVGDGLNAGAPHFVNEADRDLKHFEEAQDPGDDTHPDPAVVDRACAAGSTSRYCAAWHREHDEAGAGSGNSGGDNSSDPGPDQQKDPDTALLSMCQARASAQALRDAMMKNTHYVQQLCADPSSQPNPAGMTGSATLGGSYSSSITLATYCGQGRGRGTPAPSAERLAHQAQGGSHCGATESAGADGQCHGVGQQFGLRNGQQVNLTYGAVIGFTPFNPALDPSSQP